MMSNRTLLLIGLLFASTVGLVFIALRNPSISTPVRQATRVTQNLLKPPVAQTTLSFGTLSPTSSPSASQSLQTYSIPVNIKTNSNIVTAVQLELQYDPNIITKASVSAGDFFVNPVPLFSDVNAKTGRISFALGISPTAKGKMGEGTVAILNFSVKSSAGQNTSIAFLPKSLVTAQGVSQSVLKSAASAIITIGRNPNPQP